MDLQQARNAGADSSHDTSAGKALALLDALGGPRAVMGVSELAQVVCLPKATAHRLLAVLIESGYVRRAGDKYALSTRTFELGNQVAVARANGLRDRAMPVLTELYAQTRKTVHLAVPAGSSVLYVEKLFGPDSVRINTAVGMRRPQYATALGKTLLAFSDPPAGGSMQARYYRFTAFTIATRGLLERALDEVRDQGFATDFEETFLGVSCIAVPVLDRRTRKPVAALSLSTEATGRSVLRYKSAMLKAAEQLCGQVSRLVA
ncbi:IclR family transcriptional regulator [Streptomyces dioscori]|uniref:IclR family transcriptional regulator n=1 Tax=Streptomyces dioscori TaxID=2109333 RepID=A0A2P8PYC2_9ACTN|nr:IclR family transcriptional regulator [Streptomyces dioscori]PSM38996.1 IclR family transcriptional regulator [Streptomyces dioscori]